jgi:hypothetical protein
MTDRMQTEIITVLVKDVAPAKWNYKSEGTEEEIAKLAASISEDQSAGVPAVREVDGMFEVIDGNHRLQAIVELGWHELKVENFGPISKANAVIIARRRNHKWFEDDVAKYADLFTNEVLDEYDLDDLELIMPDSREEMETFEKLLDFDWNQYGEGKQPELEEDMHTIKFVVSEDVYHQWFEWRQRCQQSTPIKDDAEIFEFALQEALNSSFEPT